MGPYATVDFIAKLIRLTGAEREQDNVPFFLHCDPTVPDRSSAVLGMGSDPLPWLTDGLAVLEKAGVTAIAMPCNTAHFWHGVLARQTKALFFDMVSLTAEAAISKSQDGAAIGVLATTGTIQAGLYRNALYARGVRAMQPNGEVQADVDYGISAAKRGFFEEAGGIFANAAHALQNAGCQTIILGCTEIALALDALYSSLLEQLVDSNLELAKACVAWWRESHGEADQTHQHHWQTPPRALGTNNRLATRSAVRNPPTGRGL
jgi:aspartate racemase